MTGDKIASAKFKTRHTFEVLKLPDGLEVVEELHVGADGRHHVGPEQDHVRVVGLAENWREADDQGRLQVFLWKNSEITPRNCHLTGDS